jgi:glycosyltransferase involved in cell wall biosynthesis
MHVAMIDPSLFTIPYDRALISGLVQAGHTVKLHGRHVHDGDNGIADIGLEADFYRVANSPVVVRMPKFVRLAVKGIDHVYSMRRLRARLAIEKPDIIHFQWLPLPGMDHRMLAGFRKIAPLVFTVHDTNPFNGTPSSSMQRYGFFRCLSTFDVLILHTQQGYERMRAAGIDESRLTILPHGLVEPLPPQPTSVALEGPVTFLAFGKIKSYKGLDVLIEAFSLMPEELRAGARVRIVGKPYMPLEPLQEQAVRRGIADRVIVEPRFVPDDEVNALFTPNVVAVFAYREIEASGVLSFATSNGRPIIASSIGGFVETLIDGRNGLLVTPGDAACLSRAMARMISDRAFAVRCGLHSRELAETTANWLAIAERTAAVYRAAGNRTAVERPGVLL